MTVVHKFSKNQEPPQNSTRQKVIMQQLPYWGPKIIKCHRAKYFRPVDLTPGICALLLYNFRNVLIHTLNGGLLQIFMTERERERDGDRRVFSFTSVSVVKNIQQ